MKAFLMGLVVLCVGNVRAEERDYPRPAAISVAELAEFDTLSVERKALVKAALDLASDKRWFKYTFGSADPERGGFDCSGAVYYLLQGLSYEPARSSAGQYLWVRDADLLTKVGEKVTDVKDEVFEGIEPGDLVFWSGTYVPTDGRTMKITHVGMYLGTEKKDGYPVMACSTNGRSYRGRQSNGFGVYDFRVPSKKSKSKLVAFGTPPPPKDR